MRNATISRDLLQWRMEVHTRRPDPEQPHRNHHGGESNSKTVSHRPHLLPDAERCAQLVREEQHTQRQQKDMPGDIMPTHQPRACTPFHAEPCLLEERGGEEARMRRRRDSGVGVTVLRRHGEDVA